MNLRILFFLTPIRLALAVGAQVQAKEPEAPVPIIPATPAQSSANVGEGVDFQQHLYGPAGSLVSPDKARQVVEAFHGAYEKLGKPRLLIYVNRELVAEHAGLKLTSRKERLESTSPQTQVNANLAAPGSGYDTTLGKGGSEARTLTVTADNTYANDETPAPTLADKQTVREVERLFGRALRAGGASLTDQTVAASTIANQPPDRLVALNNNASRSEREALSKVADVVVEVLISSRNVLVTAVSGDQSVPVPDIQVTAIKLSDASIVGQASASDVLGKDQQAGLLARHFDVRDITEATALALMEDITTTTTK